MKLIRRKKRISDRNTTLRLYADGVPVAEIVKLTRHSTATIYQIIHSSGMRLRRKDNATFA